MGVLERCSSLADLGVVCGEGASSCASLVWALARWCASESETLPLRKEDRVKAWLTPCKTCGKRLWVVVRRGQRRVEHWTRKMERECNVLFEQRRTKTTARLRPLG